MPACDLLSVMNTGTGGDTRELAGGATESAPLTRRTRKRNERRERVFDAAIALFVERGFDETSMDDIAERAGLARTTVFNHFPRKVAFLSEWTFQRRQRAALTFGDSDLTGRPVREVLGKYFATLAELNQKTRDETSALMLMALKNTNVFVDHLLPHDLAHLVAATAAPLRESTDPEQLGRLLALGYFSAVTRWICDEPAPFDLADELARLLDTVLDGALQPATE